MTWDQIFLLALLVSVLGLFAWGKWRYDIVAFGALIAAALYGIVPPAQAFNGFTDSAVITVALILILSRGLIASGAVQLVAARISGAQSSPTLLIILLAVPVAALSAFMNNVGAFALFLPLALRLTKSGPVSGSKVLMPISFASMLGGMITLIGTPPNLIVSTYRAKAQGIGFSMFDFAPVGLMVAVAGLAYLALIGWRILPKDRKAGRSMDELVDIGKYLTEVRVGPGAGWIGRSIRQIEEALGGEMQILGLVREERRILAPNPFLLIIANDILILEARPEALEGKFKDKALVVEHARQLNRESLQDDTVIVLEASVLPNSRLIGQSASDIRLRSRFNINLLAMSRFGRPGGRLQEMKLNGGDILLLQGGRKQLEEALGELGLVPLVERGLQMLRTRRPWLAVALFAGAVIATAFSVAPPAICFAVAVIGYLAGRVLSIQEAYRACDPAVLVLLGALLPVANAVGTSGLASVFTDVVIGSIAGGNGIVALLIVIAATMTLSDVVNNAAAAAIMSPVAVATAQTLGVSADPFLLGVAIGASCAFLTPIGHQNNLLVMAPGGYRFGDYWRMGLPLELLVLAVSTAGLYLIWW